jgi:predicted TIM-barrel fold metal-dependent hydrolase
MNAATMEQAPPRMPSPPTLPTPKHACDTHTHVFAPLADFPLAGPASYAPPLAPVSLHLQTLDVLGIERGVIVQPAPYGLDLSVLLDALSRGRGQLRGIGTATGETADAALTSMRHAGVCGLRFTEARLPNGERYRGSVAAEQLGSLASRMRELSMHAQLWPSPEGIPGLLQSLLPFDVPLVLEHMGGIDIRRGVNDPAFQFLLAVLREGRIWIKLTVCRRSTAAPAYPDLRPFHDALVNANPQRLLWGSDWPFVRMDERAPDAGRLLDLFGEWVDDAVLRHMILVDNPQSLYRFDRTIQ